MIAIGSGFRFSNSQRGHTPSFSRQVFARVMRDTARLRRREGAEKAGCPLHPQPRTQKERTSARTYRSRRNTLLSLRNGFNGCFALSPVSGLYLPPSPAIRGLLPFANSTPQKGARTTRLGRPPANTANDL